MAAAVPRGVAASILLGQALLAAAFAPPLYARDGPARLRLHAHARMVLSPQASSREGTRVNRRQALFGLSVGSGLLCGGSLLQPPAAVAEDAAPAGDDADVSAAAPPAAAAAGTATALFAAGDARFLQAVYETKQGSGVLKTAVGRVGDDTRTVQVTYDPKMITYKQLLGLYWRNIDPTDGAGQFADRGPQFRPVLFVNSAEERALAEKSQKLMVDSGIYGQGAPRSIVPFKVEIKDASAEVSPIANLKKKK